MKVCMEFRVTGLTRSINRRRMFHREVGVVFLGSTAESKSKLPQKETGIYTQSNDRAGR